MVGIGSWRLNFPARFLCFPAGFFVFVRLAGGVGWGGGAGGGGGNGIDSWRPAHNISFCSEIQNPTMSRHLWMYFMSPSMHLSWSKRKGRRCLRPGALKKNLISMVTVRHGSTGPGQSEAVLLQCLREGSSDSATLLDFDARGANFST